MNLQYAFRERLTDPRMETLVRDKGINLSKRFVFFSIRGVASCDFGARFQHDLLVLTLVVTCLMG